MKSNIHTDHTLIIDELETSIKFHNLDSIFGFLPKGSYLVGGFIRDMPTSRGLGDVYKRQLSTHLQLMQMHIIN